MRVCILGYGSIGGLHLEMYNSVRTPIELSVVETDLHKAKIAAENCSGVYKNLGETFTGEFDLYDICLPTYLHYDAIDQILSHTSARVICEKPIVANLTQLVGLANRHEDFSARVRCAFVERFNEPFVQAKDWTKTHKAPYAIRLERRTKSPPNGSWYTRADLGGDLLLDLGIHDIDAAIWWTESKLESIVKHTVAKDRERVVMLMIDGSEVVIDTGWDLDANSEISVVNKFELRSGEETFSYDVLTETTDNGREQKHVAERIPKAYKTEIEAALQGSERSELLDFPSLDQLVESMRVIKNIREK